MKGKVELFKILFVTGLALMGTAVFIESFKVASLSDLKSGEKRLQMELEEKYNLTPPEKPVDESQYLLAPDVPEGEASQEQKNAYDNAMKEHEGKVKVLREKYEAEMKTYDATYKAFRRQAREMEMKKDRERDVNKKLAEKLEKDMQVSQFSVNEFMVSTILRFLGSLILLAGSLGILILGDGYERAGVLVVIGFGIKTIIGL